MSSPMTASGMSRTPDELRIAPGWLAMTRSL
jgi:hypothetical protein